MNAKAQRVAIAEACGVKPQLVEYWVTDGDSIVMNSEHRQECEEWLARLPASSPYRSWTVKPFYRYPNYTDDLNAMHEAEKVLSLSQRDQYQQWLYRIVEKECRMAPIYWLAINSTAKQRAEAFLRTIGRWEDGK